ncbi:MAG: phosphotransferase [Planctomycetota bacterium]
MRPLDPTEEKLASAIIERHVPGLEAAPRKLLPSGEGNRSILFDGGCGRRFVARLVEDLRIHKLQDELAVLGTLASAGLPVPQVIAADLTKAVFPVLYRVTRFIEGVDFEEALRTGQIGAQEGSLLAGELGCLLARFHSMAASTLARRRSSGRCFEGQCRANRERKERPHPAISRQMAPSGRLHRRPGQPS